MGNTDVVLQAGQERVSLEAMGSVSEAGRFEVDAITAGVGNGWKFSEEVLQASVDLWGGVECFVDHGGFWGGRSVRDLGGVFEKPRWEPERKAVRLELRTVGPAADLVKALGREMLAEGGAKPRIGFSADVIFTAKSREVKSILRVVSLDLVFNPARGGAFVRALNSIGGGYEMATQNDETTTTTPQPAQPVTVPAQPVTEQLREDAAAMRTFLAVQHEQQALADQAEEARKLRARNVLLSARCGYVLGQAACSHGRPRPQAIRGARL